MLIIKEKLFIIAIISSMIIIIIISYSPQNSIPEIASLLLPAHWTYPHPERGHIQIPMTHRPQPDAYRCGSPCRWTSISGYRDGSWDCRPECALEPSPVDARLAAMAQLWAVHLEFGKENVLATVATSGLLALGLGGKCGKRVFSLGEVVASDSIFYILG